MKQNTHRSIIHKYSLFLGLFLVFCSNILNAQSASGIALNWDVEVGCQTYFNEEDRKEIFLEDITDGVCLRVCESGRVTYNLTGLPLAGAAPYGR